MIEKEKSLKLNMALNTIKGLMGILFPLISFPYVSKVLGVDNVGKYSFSTSVISYFILISGLGIGTYAIREGARIRESKELAEEFINQMFSISVVSTTISYALFILSIIVVPKLKDYIVLLIILSFEMIFKMIGVDWVSVIYEDYIYITVRSILFQFLALIMLFLFVKSETDLIIYTCISVMSSVGASVLNYFHAKKYCPIHFVRKIDWKKHIYPILILFAISITITIYVSSDTIILGFLCDDITVGIYSVSTKIYSTIKAVISSILIVSIPRLSAVIGKKNKKELNLVASNIYHTLLTLVIPTIIGIIILKKEIVLILSNESYLAAVSSLVLLSIALLFCMCAWFWQHCILVPLQMETEVFRVTVVSALLNIFLNFLTIPFWKENAAAVTTIIAEALSFFWCKHIGKRYVDIIDTSKIVGKISVGCIAMFLVIFFLRNIISNQYIFIGSAVFSAVFVYFISQLVLKNQVILDVILEIKNKVKR